MGDAEASVGVPAAQVGVGASVGVGAGVGVGVGAQAEVVDMVVSTRAIAIAAVVLAVILLAIVIWLFVWVLQLRSGAKTHKDHLYLSNTVAQSIPTAANTVATFDTIERVVGKFAVDTPVSEVKPEQRGRYQVSYQVAFDANATGVRHAHLLVNGSVVYAPLQVGAAAGGNLVELSSSTSVFFNGCTDTVSLVVFQSSGGALDIGTTILTRLHLDYLGPNK